MRFVLLIIFLIELSFAYFSKNNQFRSEDIFDKSFNVYNAYFCAQVANSIYDDDFFHKSGRSYKLLERNGFSSIVAGSRVEGIAETEFVTAVKRWNGKKLILVAFRGTVPTDVMDVLTDISIVPQKTYWRSGVFEIHKGFWDSEQAFEKFMPQLWITSEKKSLQEVIEDKNYQFLITGHSLGGAIATIFAARLVDLGVDPKNIVVYTFGAPAVGDRRFAKEFDNKLEYFYRIRHLFDPIPVSTSKDAMNVVRAVLALGSAALKKPRWMAKALTAKLEFIHIGRLYVIDPDDNTLHYKDSELLFHYRLKRDIQTIKNLFNLTNHSMKETYLSAIGSYCLDRDGSYAYYCYGNFKKIPYEYVKDVMNGELIREKSEMGNFIVGYVQIRNRIEFLRVKLGRVNYCFEKILDRYYHYNDQPKYIFFQRGLPFYWLWFEKALKFRFEEEKRENFFKVFSFLNDEKFMRVVHLSGIEGVVGPIKKDRLVSFFNLIAQEYGMATPIQKSYGLQEEYEDLKIFIDDFSKKHRFIRKEEMKRALAFFKAANSKSKWIVNSNSVGFQYLIQHNFDPYLYYLYKVKKEYEPKSDFVKGLEKMMFLKRVYEIIQKGLKR